MSICLMCLEEVEQDALLEEFGDIFTQADMLGPESCTEHEQVVLEGRLCSLDCYYAMQDAEFDYRRLKKDNGGWDDEMRACEVDYEGLDIMEEDELAEQESGYRQGKGV